MIGIIYVNVSKENCKKKLSLQETEMDIESSKSVIHKVLSCKIFDNEQFEINFTEELKKSGALYFSLLNKKLCFSIWASRFGRKTLLAAAFSFVEHSDYQFYQGFLVNVSEHINNTTLFPVQTWISSH